jgi:hypothetical protein
MTTQQLIVQDMGGFHNANLEATRARLIRGGSYKKQRVILIIPAIKPIPPKVYLSHCSLIFPPNQPVVRILAEGMEVGDSYSQAIANVLSHPYLSEFEYICTIEADNCPPNDGVLKLIERMENHPEMSAISGLYYTKFCGGVAQIWGSPQQDPVFNCRPQLPVPGELVEAYGIGMGFALWRTSMFKDARLPRPWFKTNASKNGVGTQDLHFASEIRKFGYRLGVDCDVKVGHYDFENDMMW